MALTATLIAFASGLAAKVRTRQEENHLSQWRAEVERLDRVLAVQTSLTDHWKDEARALAKEVARLLVENERAAGRLRDTEAQRDALRMLQDGRQQAQLGGPGFYGQGLGQLLGAQNLQLPADWVCTCIPDRHTALRQG